MRIIGVKCREKGLPFIYHTDGNVESIIPDLRELGVCALHPLEPLALDIRRVERQYDQKLSLIGGIDLLSVLALGERDFLPFHEGGH